MAEPAEMKPSVLEPYIVPQITGTKLREAGSLQLILTRERQKRKSVRWGNDKEKQSLAV